MSAGRLRLAWTNFEILVFVGEQNLQAAERLIELFDRKLDLIAEMPGVGPARPELGKGIRSFPVENTSSFIE